jgi:hypothetical protein
MARIEGALQARPNVSLHLRRHFAARDSARTPMNRQSDLPISSLHVRLDSLLTHGRLASQLIFLSARDKAAGSARMLGIFLFAREGTGATST